MYNKKKIDEIRRQAYQAVEKAKEMLAKEGELSDADQAKVDEFLQNADKLEKRAKQLEFVMEKDIELADAEHHEKEDREKAEAKKKSAVVKFDHGWEFLKAVINARLYNRWDRQRFRLSLILVRRMIWQVKLVYPVAF
ncbi:MAG: hypothetical protein ACE5I1_12970 [bacterium]